MNLTRKDSTPQYKKPDPVDTAMFEIHWGALIPTGKWAGYTLSDVKKNDEGYYKWMIKENMLDKWFLYKLRGEVMTVRVSKPVWNKLPTDRGEVWYGIRIIEESTNTAPEEWYRE